MLKKQKKVDEKEKDKQQFTETDFRVVEEELKKCGGPGLTAKEIDQNWFIMRKVAKVVRGEFIVLWNGYDADRYTEASRLLSAYWDWKGRIEFGKRQATLSYKEQ